jgi:hypothetical protein
MQDIGLGGGEPEGQDAIPTEKRDIFLKKRTFRMSPFSVEVA